VLGRTVAMMASMPSVAQEAQSSMVASGVDLSGDRLAIGLLFGTAVDCTIDRVSMAASGAP
jgi:hypothetical protein